MKKYVVLEHLLLPDRGKRFWSTNTDNNCYINDGREAYKEVHFTDNTEDAIRVSQKWNFEALPSYSELLEYWENNSDEIDKFYGHKT